MTTEVWISTRGQISEATWMAIPEALEEESTKDTPTFGSEDLEEIHRSGKKRPSRHLQLPRGSICHRWIE